MHEEKKRDYKAGRGVRPVAPGEPGMRKPMRKPAGKTRARWLVSWILLLPFLPPAQALPGGIAIDVGHTLSQPGATSARGVAEFVFNRTLAVEIGAALKARGRSGFLVGAEGGMERLTNRTAAASSASFFLSVHHDSVQPHYLSTWEHEGVQMNYSDRFSGYSLFVSRKNPALAASIACASAIGASLRSAGFRPSLYHAERIAGEAKAFADKENGVHFYDNLIVLKSARSPAVLFEAGVIVNRDEELELRSEERRLRMADAVAAGLARCVPEEGKPARPVRSGRAQ